MKHSALTTGVLGAVLLLPISTAFAAPHAGGAMGGAMGSAPMHSMAMHPMTTTPSTTTTTAPIRGPSHTGQPSKSCQATGSQTPGMAANAPGSAFNPNGQAGTVYAGQQPQNSRNTASISQYDVACTRGGR